MTTPTRNARAPLTAPARRRAPAGERAATVLREITFAAIAVLISAGLAIVAAAYAKLDAAVVIAARVAQLAAIVAATGLAAAVLAAVAACHHDNDRSGVAGRTPARRHATRRRPRRRCSCPEHRRRR